MLPPGAFRMFEDSTQQREERPRSPWPLVVSVALHAGAIAALAFAAARTPALGAGERPIDVVFLRAAILDAAAPPDAPASPAERRAARERQAMLDRLVQPTTVPDAASPGTAAPAPGAAGTDPGALATGGAAPGDANLPVDAGGGLTLPELISSSMVEPVYPEAAPCAAVQGQAVLEMTIDDQGRVAGVKVLRGLGETCDEALVAAVRQWRFRPATRYGKPIKVRHILPILSQPQ
jgi:TonB family protein